MVVWSSYSGYSEVTYRRHISGCSKWFQHSRLASILSPVLCINSLATRYGSRVASAWSFSSGSAVWCIACPWILHHHVLRAHLRFQRTVFPRIIDVPWLIASLEFHRKNVQSHHPIASSVGYTNHKHQNWPVALNGSCAARSAAVANDGSTILDVTGRSAAVKLLFSSWNSCGLAALPQQKRKNETNFPKQRDCCSIFHANPNGCSCS